jgi:hypothetical protein
MTIQADVHPFTFVIIPDTQNLIRDAPRLYGKMTSWIADNADRLGIDLVVHLGDVINGRQDGEHQFRLAARAHRTILDAGIRLLVASGNHDYDDMAAQTGLSLFNRMVGAHALGPERCFDATFEPGSEENCYATVDRPDRLIFLLMEYLPRPEVVAWADKVLTAHRERIAIVFTHSFLQPDGDRTRNGTATQLDGQQLWDSLLRRHSNVMAIFCGHKVGGRIAYRVDLGDAGNPVLASFQNWQMVEQGGEGRIRLVQMRPTTRDIRMKVVNTSTDQDEHEPGYDVDLTLDQHAAGLRYPPLPTAAPSAGRQTTTAEKP